MGSPAREGGGGQGYLSQPSAHRRPTAAGKRPVQAGSPGLSTPSKPKRGRGAAGASTASKAPAPGRRRPAAERGLFAVGFTRSTAVMLSGDEGTGREPTPLRGAETPGKGHGRANSPWRGSFSRNVYTKGEAWGAARWLCHVLLLRCPCTHSLQDLNRLTYCFCKFWNHGILVVPLSGGP